MKLSLPRIGSQKYPLPLSFSDTLSIVSILVTTSPSRVLLIMLSDRLSGGLLSLNQPVVSATLLVLLSKIMQLNVASTPLQYVLLAGCRVMPE